MDTTSISELPSVNQTSNNITLTQNEVQQQMPQQMPQQNPNNIVLSNNEINNLNSQLLSQQNTQNMQNTQNSTENTNYNELISQIQKASATGATVLPSRDIPINPNIVNNDVEIKPNFIPPPQVEEDYINNMQTPENLILENNNQQKSLDNLEVFYNEFQMPIVVALLYFLFQLPILKKYSKQFMPSLFKSDGNPNLSGYIINSILFASMFYIVFKLINNITSQIS